MIEIEPSPYFKKSGIGHAVTKALPFVESGAGEYTHRVRHITLYTVLGKSHMAVACWCGMSINVGSRRRRSKLVDSPTTGRPVCATCEGRVIGAGIVPPREIGGKHVMYAPRNRPCCC